MNVTRLERLQQVIENIAYLQLEASCSLVDDLYDLSMIPSDDWHEHLNKIVDQINIYIDGEEKRSGFLKWIIRGHIIWILSDPLTDTKISESVRRRAQEVHVSSV